MKILFFINFLTIFLALACVNKHKSHNLDNPSISQNVSYEKILTIPLYSSTSGEKYEHFIEIKKYNQKNFNTTHLLEIAKEYNDSCKEFVPIAIVNLTTDLETLIPSSNSSFIQELKNENKILLRVYFDVKSKSIDKVGVLKFGKIEYIKFNNKFK